LKSDYDVIVVGSGPAGSSAAYAAASKDIKVAILEKDPHVATSIRTSGVTWIDDMKKFSIPENFYNKIKNYSFHSSNNKVLIKGNIPSAAVLDVRKTYTFLAKRAVDRGAHLFTNNNVTNVHLNKTQRLVNINKNKFTSKIVIDASGFRSVVARSLGLVKQWKIFGTGAEYESYAENIVPDTWSLMVGSKYSPSGYAWIFPVNKNVVRIGVGITRPYSTINPIDQLNKIIQNKTGPIKDLGKLNHIELHYGLIPNDGPVRNTVYDNILLVGDSAGYSNPLVLEGIRYAIKFGRIAGDVASKAIVERNISKSFLLEYEKQWQKLVYKKIISSYVIQKRWLKLSDGEWDKELNIIKNLTVYELVNFMKSDFGLIDMIKFIKKNPHFVVRNFFQVLHNTFSK